MPFSAFFQWNPTQHPTEDAFRFSDERGVYVVADGVTRTTQTTGGYPPESPATAAAERVVTVLYELLQSTPYTPENFQSACRRANEMVKYVNERLGLWDKPDYYERDLAGAVFSGVFIAPNYYLAGYLGDCRVAHFSGEGKRKWISPDLIAPVRAYFPSLPETKERRIIIRRDFRNKPVQGMDKTYGVLTGEDTALAYVQTVIKPYEAGDVLVVCSDGAARLIENEGPTLCRGTEHDIRKAISAARSNDEGTLLVIYT